LLRDYGVLQESDTLHDESAHTASSLVGTLLSSVFGILAVAIFLNRFSIAQFGEFLLFMATVAVFQIPLAWMMPSVFIHTYNEANASDRHDRALGSAIVLWLLILIPEIAMIAVLKDSALPWLHGLVVAPWTLIGLLGVSGVFAICRQVLRARDVYRLPMILGVLVQALFIVLMARHIAGMSMDVPESIGGVVNALFVATAIGAVLSLLFVFLGGGVWPDFVMISCMIREFRLQGVRDACESAVLQIDLFMLAALMGRWEVGVYGLCHWLMRQCAQWAGFLRQILMPVYLRWSRHENQEAEQHFHETLVPHLLLACAFGLAAVIPLARWVFVCLGVESVYAPGLFRLLVFAAFFGFIRAVTSSSLSSHSTSWIAGFRTGLLLVAVAVYGIGDWLLIPHLGVWGAAIMSVAVWVLLPLAETVVIYRTLGQHGLWKIWMPVFPLLAVLLSFELLPSMMAFPGALSGLIVALLGVRQSDVFSGDATDEVMSLRWPLWLQDSVVQYLQWMQHLHHVNSEEDAAFEMWKQSGGEWDPEWDDDADEDEDIDSDDDFDDDSDADDTGLNESVSGCPATS